MKTRLYKNPPPYFIVLASSVKTKEVEVIEFHRIEKDTCKSVPPNARLIQTLCNVERCSSTGLILGQRPRRWPNIKPILGSAQDYGCDKPFQQLAGVNPMLDYCWISIYGVEPALKQHQVNCSWLMRCPAKTTHWNNVWSTLAHRLRRWPNIKPTLFQCLVVAGRGLSGRNQKDERRWRNVCLMLGYRGVFAL